MEKDIQYKIVNIEEHKIGTISIEIKVNGIQFNLRTNRSKPELSIDLWDIKGGHPKNIKMHNILTTLHIEPL